MSTLTISVLLFIANCLLLILMRIRINDAIDCIHDRIDELEQR